MEHLFNQGDVPGFSTGKCPQICPQDQLAVCDLSRNIKELTFIPYTLTRCSRIIKKQSNRQKDQVIAVIGEK